MPDSEPGEGAAERPALELGSLVRDRVARRAESAGRVGEQFRHVAAGRLLEEDPCGERCARRKDIENDGELEGEETEESRDLGEVQHPDVIRILGADRSRLDDRDWRRRLDGLLVSHAQDGSTGQLPADPRQVKADGPVSGEGCQGHRLNQVPDDVGVAAGWSSTPGRASPTPRRTGRAGS